MVNSFTFNGIRKNYIKSINRDTPIIAPRTHNFQSIPKRAGALLMNTTTEIRTLKIEAVIKKPTNLTFDKLKEDMATWLTSDVECPLKFDIESDRTYFAILNDISDFEIINDDTAKTIISFVCYDPYKYSDDKRLFMPNKLTSPVYYVDNLGNVDTYPIIRVDVKNKINYFSVITEDNYLQIGEPVTIDGTAFEPETLIFSDNMTTVNGWSEASYVDNGYIITGGMESSGNYFYAARFGGNIEPWMWQGPSLKRSLPKPLKDFRMRINAHFWNKPEIRTGMIEIYGLNASNETVFKIGIEDLWAEYNNIRAKVALGGVSNRYVMQAGSHPDPSKWDDYSGILEIKRVNNHWGAYFSTIAPDGSHTAAIGGGGSINYHDIDGTYGSEITQVQVAIRVYPGSEKADMGVHDINIWEINEKPTPTTPLVIAQAGDVLEIDHYKNTVRKNGELVQGIKDFASNFFPLKPGRNKLYVLPPNKGDVTVTYKERYL